MLDEHEVDNDQFKQIILDELKNVVKEHLHELVKSLFRFQKDKWYMISYELNLGLLF